ncbi:MAG: valine--tRNA ligase [Patescibacteria group bacterium]|nr:valine--tRNA ligase [Patescibacteria group bacterium]
MSSLSKKYNILEQEQKWQQFWDQNNIYKFDQTSQKPIFSVDTPPPYASAAHLHVGHAMSYTQAEFIIRFKRMQGYNIFYPMGFDDNGLPTERYVEQKYKITDKSKISREEFIKLCLQETKEVAKTYTSLWKSLGLSIDWSLLYSTISPMARRISQKSFLDLYKKNLLEHREEPTIWCSSCQTALAQADLEDSEEKSKLNYINFSLATDKSKKLLIATSRPELLAACVALYVNPDDSRYKNLINQKAIVPIFHQEVPIKSDPSVDPKFGTGLMMVCTWGDSEDVAKWKKDKLETRLIFDKSGHLNEWAKLYQGLTLKEARTKIIDKLQEQKLLVKQEDITHVLNVHERCKTPVEFYLTKQWFIKILDNIEDFKRQGSKINWFPLSMKKKYDTWLDGLKWDWNISRERYYGVPFPVWYCDKCHEIILPEEKDLPVDPIENKPKNPCPKCQSNNFIPEKDVMDTWMTSSLTPQINSHWQEENENKKLYPMSLRIQAFEIIRTWLFYTIVKSWYHEKSLPWQDVMISGHGLDKQGRKISKSLGNYEPVANIIKRYGSDALRYWSAGSNLGNNLRYKEEEVKDGKKLITKLFNASKFCLMFLQNSKLEIDSKLYPIDAWILSKLQNTIKTTTRYFNDYEYSKAKKEVYNFFWKNFADNYIELSKSRLYNDENKEAKNSAQATLYICLINILKMFAPILPHITEEIWQTLKQDNKELETSIHISSWPEIDKKLINEKQENLGDQIVEILSEVRKTKSNANLAMNKDIKEIIIDSKEKDLEKFFPDLANATHAQQISFGTGNLKLNEELKIKIIL